MGSQLDPKADVLIGHRDIRRDQKCKARDREWNEKESVPQRRPAV